MRSAILAAVAAMLATSSLAQTTVPATYAAKPGESINLGVISWVNSATCQNLAIAKSEVEILSGPPGMTVEVREAMVVPNAVGTCKNEVKGGYVWLTVPTDIQTSNAHVVLRVTHHDRNGPQQRGFAANLLIVH